MIIICNLLLNKYRKIQTERLITEPGYIIDFVAPKVISYCVSDYSGDYHPKKCSAATMERDFSISPLFHF